MGKKSRRGRPSKKERKVNNDAMKAKTKFNEKASISTSKCKRMERAESDAVETQPRDHGVRTTRDAEWRGRWLFSAE